MQKILFGDKELTVLKDPISKGTDFKGFSLTGTDFSSKTFDSYTKKTVFSVFPAIHTGVCDVQTKTIVKLAQKYKNIDFIAVSLDLPPTLSNWCALNNGSNIQVFSDYKTKEFGNKFGLLIDELQLLNRAIFVVEKSGKLLYCEYKKQITEQIDFETLEKFLE